MIDFLQIELDLNAMIKVYFRAIWMGFGVLWQRCT
jgi:hypothetical protein